MKSIKLFLSAIIFSMALFTFNTSFAQYRTANLETSSSTFETEVAILVEGIETYGFDVVDTDIVEIKKGEAYLWDLTCYGRNEYMVFGYAEKGVEDLGLYVYNNKDELITTDNGQKNDGVTFANFTANYTTDARIYAKNVDSRSSYKKYKVAVIIVRK